MSYKIYTILFGLKIFMFQYNKFEVLSGIEVVSLRFTPKCVNQNDKANGWVFGSVACKSPMDCKICEKVWV